MISWILVVWMCSAPGNCIWQLAGGGFPSENDCLEAAFKLNRYAECIKMTVPTPGSPR
jgi:hypothetical protein